MAGTLTTKSQVFINSSAVAKEDKTVKRETKI
jgi:hypothetical protein